jgi:hypothetical protein
MGIGEVSMWFEVAAAAAVTLSGLAAWGFRLIREIHDLENLSARVVGPPDEVVGLWPGVEDQAS